MDDLVMERRALGRRAKPMVHHAIQRKNLAPLSRPKTPSLRIMYVLIDSRIYDTLTDGLSNLGIVLGKGLSVLSSGHSTWEQGRQ